MNGKDLPHQWADQFGLAITPLFKSEDALPGASHNVLLDGGFGSFALSVTSEELWRAQESASWAWSSNLAHHVTVTGNVVAVRRWDQPRAELLSRKSVETKIESFYSYLIADRVRSSVRVVEHVLGLFRRVRSLVIEAGIPDDRSIDAFLAFLSVTIEAENASRDGKSVHLSKPSDDLLRALPTNGVEALREDLVSRTPMHSFRLFPSLAVRHAGSEIFQEAHFELLRTSTADLFGYHGPAESKSITRGGAHFTPAALARTVVEQTLFQVENLAGRKRLVVMDPACGSGAFLHEAFRTLRRLRFQGQIVLVGRDVSRSAIAITDFVIRQAILDWTPTGGIEVDIYVADSLESQIPKADVILMNPPFMAWSALDDRQKDQMHEVLGHRLKGRGDLSMAFITRALDAVADGGAFGVLFPSSLLTLQAAEAWRGDLLERSDLRLLASLGDYGLFSHALVQVASAVFAKPTNPRNRRNMVTALITSNSADATGNALRTLRRLHYGDGGAGEDDSWQLFEVPKVSFMQRPTWRLSSPKTELALARLMEAGITRMADLFEVRQGVRTGNNRAFLLDQSAFRTIPAREKKFFRPAIMNDSIQDGRLQQLYWVFYPYGQNGLLIETEKQLLEAAPTFAKRFLIPQRETLSKRASLAQAERGDWWGLSRSRVSWSLGSGPRLVSKYFGGPGGFATDLDAQFIVVQGFAWFPKWESPLEDNERGGVALSTEDLLCAYVALMNSRRFGRILELFSPHVAGGQFDLSPRYVDTVPIPNLNDLARNEHLGRSITRLAALGRNPRIADPEWRSTADRITTELYGGDFFNEI